MATLPPGSSNSRGRPSSPSSPPASSSESTAYTVAEKETGEVEDGEPPMVPVVLALPAPARVWPVAFGSMDLQGRMSQMEDAVSLQPTFHTWIDGTPMHMFAVFDGHGGPHVSALCRDQMHLILAEELAAEGERFLQRRREHHQQAAGGGPAAAWVDHAEEEQSWRAALLRAFARVDELASLACACGVATFPRCACPLSGVIPAMVGSTAVVTVLVRGRIVVANCGDSRAVLCRGPAGSPPIPLSIDHKPDRPDERARIESVGGQVLYVNGPRVRGILAMSRALGDRILRPEVISEPEITVTQRTATDQCLILASDGMWDAVSNETACSIALKCLEDGANQPPSDATGNEAGAVDLNLDHRCGVTAATLAWLALCRGSPDNISIIIVDLRNRAR